MKKNTKHSMIAMIKKVEYLKKSISTVTCSMLNPILFNDSSNVMFDAAIAIDVKGLSPKMTKIPSDGELTESLPIVTPYRMKNVMMPKSTPGLAVIKKEQTIKAIESIT